MTRRAAGSILAATLLAPIQPIVGKDLADAKKALDLEVVEESGSVNVTAYKYLMFVDPSVINPRDLNGPFPNDWPKILVIFTRPQAQFHIDPIQLYKL